MRPELFCKPAKPSKDNLTRLRKRQRLQALIIYTAGLCAVALAVYTMTRCLIDLNSDK